MAALHKCIRLYSYFGVLLALSVSSIACAEKANDPTIEIVSFFERVCFKDIGNLSRVSDLAQAEQWRIQDASNVAGKDGVVAARNQSPRLVSTERSSAWSTDIAGETVIVAVTKPKRFERPKCEIVTAGKPERSPLDEGLVGERIVALGGKGNYLQSESQPPVAFPNRVSRTYFSRDTAQSAAGQREPRTAISYLIETDDNRVVHTITLYGERMQ